MSFIPDKDKAFSGILQAIHFVFMRGGYSGINQGYICLLFANQEKPGLI